LIVPNFRHLRRQNLENGKSCASLGYSFYVCGERDGIESEGSVGWERWVYKQEFLNLVRKLLSSSTSWWYVLVETSGGSAVVESYSNFLLPAPSMVR
jgi:hypothetical protein